MNILVTGGCGFIGSNFILYWAKRYPKHLITNLDKLTYAANPSNLAALTASKNYRLVKGDITDTGLVDRLMPGQDILIHFAAESHVDRSLTNPQIFIKTNVLGTQVLLDAAVKHKISRFHHISTDEVFGSLPLDSANKFSETTAYDPRSPYSASKAASDHLVRAYFHSFGLPITITNCSNNYGPFQSPEKFIPRMITNLIDGQKIPIYGDGLNVRDWLYVEDHCTGIDAVISRGKIGETYCLGGMSENVNNLTLAKTILEIMGHDEKQLEFISDRPGHDRRYAVDWSKIHRELGWSPKHDFREALKLTIDWYLRNSSFWRCSKTESEKFYQSNIH